jgi:hypothetical protein
VVWEGVGVGRERGDEDRRSRQKRCRSEEREGVGKRLYVTPGLGRRVGAKCEVKGETNRKLFDRGRLCVTLDLGEPLRRVS